MSNALAIIDQEQAKSRFVSIYQAVHKVDNETAQQFFEVESFNFKRIVNENAGLQKCSDVSVAGTFLEVVSNGLSFDSSSKHVYMMPRNVKTATGWETRMTYSYASDGLIFLCTAAGSIQGCTPPVVVYEGDKIEVGSSNGATFVNHTKVIPRASKKILGGYVYVTVRGKQEAFWMDIEEVERLSSFSAKSNKGKANALYTSGPDGQVDEGFFKTKIVKAALKNYRKKKTLSDNYIDDEVAFDEDITLIESPKDLPEEPITAKNGTEESDAQTEEPMSF